METEICAVCGRASRHKAGARRAASGTPDLDTRPPEQAGPRLALAVRRCSACGYCAPRLARAPAEARATVEAPAYRRQLADRRWPELARSFLGCSLILQAQGRLDAAGWAALQAAWACDDLRALRRAAEARARAADLFIQARTHGLRFADQAGGEEAILADIFRRAGRFPQAARWCKAGLAAEPPEELVRQVLAYLARLIRRRDARRHTLAEAEAG